MPTRTFTDEERAVAKHNRRKARRRLAEEASATVDQLLAEKAWQGRVMSLVALKCGDCSGWQKAEIVGCTVASCPLYPLRPYHD